MVSQELLNYVKQQVKNNVSEQDIKATLLVKGWSESDINTAIAAISNMKHNTNQGLPGVIDIVLQALSTYKKHYITFIGVSALPTIIFVMLLAVFMGGLGLLNRSLGDHLSAMHGINLLSRILFTPIVFAIIAWGQLALIYAVTGINEKISIIGAYRRSFGKILSYWWVSFLVSAIVACGFLLFIIPGIIFAVWFSFASFVLVAENIKGMNALLKSKEYIKGHSASVVWRLSGITGIALLFALVPVMLFSVIPVPFAKEISNIIAMLFLTPFATICLFTLYNNLKSIKGEFAFTPSRRAKLGFIAIIIFGLAIIPVIIFSVMFLGFHFGSLIKTII